MRQTDRHDQYKNIQKMFNDISPQYDLLNSIMSFRMHHRWRRNAVRLAKLSPGNIVLDLCCGTGDFAIEASKMILPNGHVVGVDFSHRMLAHAKTKLKRINASNISLLLADAMHLPFRNACFDCVTIGWGLRNLTHLGNGLIEIARILKPGGRLISLDNAKPDNGSAQWTHEWVSSKVLPALGSIFGHKDAYSYLPKSISHFLTAHELTSALKETGFVHVKMHKYALGAVCLHIGEKT